MTERKKSQTSLDKYEKAFLKFINSTANDFEIKELREGGPAIVKDNEECYNIYSATDMDQSVRSFFGSEDEAAFVPLELWTQVIEEVHFETEFYINLLHHLNREEKLDLQLALTISKQSANPIDSFWRLLYDRFDRIYPKAILAAVKTYDLQPIADELLELMINNGDTYFNEIGGGVFEHVNLHENVNTDDDLFYIFNVDPVSWNSVDS